jgi:hypothetical protein
MPGETDSYVRVSMGVAFDCDVELRNRSVGEGRNVSFDGIDSQIDLVDELLHNRHVVIR